MIIIVLKFVKTFSVFSHIVIEHIPWGGKYILFDHRDWFDFLLLIWILFVTFPCWVTVWWAGLSGGVTTAIYVKTLLVIRNILRSRTILLADQLYFQVYIAFSCIIIRVTCIDAIQIWVSLNNFGHWQGPILAHTD